MQHYRLSYPVCVRFVSGLHDVHFAYESRKDGIEVMFVFIGPRHWGAGSSVEREKYYRGRLGAMAISRGHEKAGL